MRWMFMVACAAFAGGPLAAQAGPGLTLARVYGRLDERHPRIEAATARVAAARARIGPAGRWPDPAIQFALMNRNLPGLGLQDPLGMNQVQVMQMIPLAGKTGLATRAARAAVDAEEAGATETRLELRAQAAMVFYDLYATDRAIDAMLESRQLLTGVLEASRAMYAEGQGRQADVLRAQVEIARMDEEIIRMRAMRDAMAARLGAITRLGVDETLPSPILPGFPEPLPARDSLERLALAYRTDAGGRRRPDPRGRRAGSSGRP